MAITASQVKELRDATNVSMMECKRALVETDGDITIAIENLRKVINKLKLAKQKLNESEELWRSLVATASVK